MLSGLTTALNPGFSPWSETIPFAAKLAKSELPLDQGEILMQALKKLQQLVAIPGRIDHILGKIESGQISINSNLSPKSLHAIRRIEQTQWRSASAITSAGLLISGVQLLNNGQAPEFSWLLITSALLLSLKSLRRVV